MNDVIENNKERIIQQSKRIRTFKVRDKAESMIVQKESLRQLEDEDQSTSHRRKKKEETNGN